MWIPPLLLTTEDPGAGGVLKMLSSPPIGYGAYSPGQFLSPAVFGLDAEVAAVPKNIVEDDNPPVPVLYEAELVNPLPDPVPEAPPQLLSWIVSDLVQALSLQRRQG